MILVTGATGTLGSHLILKLLQKEERIIALKRETSNLDNIRKIFSFYHDDYNELFQKIEWRNADLTDLVSLNDAFENIDVVYHCGALISMNNNNYDKLYKTNVEGTANIVNLCLQHNVKKLCHVSSIASIGINTEGLTSEKDLLNPEETSSHYSLTKYYAELEVWRGIEEGLNAVIVNPSVILAPYIPNKKISFLIKFFMKRNIKYYTNGQKGYIDVNDLSEIMIKLTESNISSQRFIVSAENLSFKNIIDYINSFFNFNESYKNVSKKKLNFIRIALSFLFLGKSPISKQIIYYLVNNEIYSNEKLLKEIDFEFIPIKDSINNILSIYLNNF